MSTPIDFLIRELEAVRNLFLLSMVAMELEDDPDETVPEDSDVDSEATVPDDNTRGDMDWRLE